MFASHAKFGMQSAMIPPFIPMETSSGSSIKSGKSGKSTSNGDSLSHYHSNSSISTVQSNGTTKMGGPPGYYHQNVRNGSISSALSGGPPSPTQPFASGQGYHNGYGGKSGAMGALAEEEPLPPQYSYEPQSFAELDDYRQCLQWLQQTCRPVFMKELVQLHNVPVPITAANTKDPSHIGGTRNVQVASWKQSQVQIVPIDRWGSPEDVLGEVRKLDEPAPLSCSVLRLGERSKKMSNRREVRERSESATWQSSAVLTPRAEDRFSSAQQTVHTSNSPTIHLMGFPASLFFPPDIFFVFS